MAVVQQMLSEKVTMTIRDEPLARQRRSTSDSMWRRSDGSATGRHQSRSHLGIRTVAKLASKVAARVCRSVMARVFSPATPEPVCQNYRSSGSGDRGGTSGVSGARSLSGAVWEALVAIATGNAAGLQEALDAL